jgi:hypothetical protein
MSKPLLSVLGLFLALYFSTLILNPGFMGTDEYWTGITRYVPAQTQNISNILKNDDVKSSTQILPLLATSHLALSLGFDSAWAQYRFVHLFWGSFGILILFLSINRYIPRNERTFVFLVFSLYFAAPFIFTRSMYESLSAPFVLLSALSLREFKKSLHFKEALISTVAISLAFAFRPQTGIAALAVVGYLMYLRQYRIALLSSLTGLGFFIIFGLSDLWVRGEFHQSLKDILFYNVQHGASYAVQPWYFYIALSVLLLMLPFLIGKSWWLIAKSRAKEQSIFWLFIVLILGLHSFFPQKWERFVIPVMPLFLLLLADWLRLLWASGSKKRLYLILGFNFAFLIPTSFWPAQGNLISFSLYLRDQKHIKQIYRYNNSPEWITEVFIERRDWHWIEVSEPPQSLMCHERFVMNEADFRKFDFPQYQVDIVFDTNPIEKLSYRFNPTKNKRRTPLFLIKNKNC